MVRKLADAEIVVTKPSGSPTFTVPESDIINISRKERISALRDDGEFTLRNDDGKYSPEITDNSITTGDKLVLRTQYKGDASLSDEWTAIAGPVSYENDLDNPPRKISVPVSDYVFSILAWRKNVFNSFEGETVNNILTTLINNNASEIGTSQIGTVGVTTNYSANGKQLLEIVKDLEALGDALSYNDGTDLVFEPIENKSAKFTLEAGHNGDFGTISGSSSDDELANVVRVDGSIATEVGDEQTTQSATETVTESSRKTTQLDIQKSEVDKIDIYTSTTGSGEQMTVRLQKDDGGSPVDPTNPNEDIAKRRLDSAFLANGDYTTFLFPEHTLPDPDPWVIVETNGSTGQEVGVDGSSNLTYKAYYPYPLITRTRDQDSIDEYRQRDMRIKDDKIKTLDESKDLAQSKLAHASEPRQLLNFNALSVRAHKLTTGEAIDANYPEENINGTYVIKSKDQTIEQSVVETNIEAQEVDSL